MPNWCNNSVVVTSKNEKKLKEFRNKAVGKSEDSSSSDLSLQELVPMPKEYEDGEKWYNWRVKHWGTKWDIDANLYDDTVDTLCYSFDSAWSPPIDALAKISEDYPDLVFNLEYEELGMCFAGEVIFEDGIYTDNCYTLEYGKCPECGEETQLLRGECSCCGAGIDFVIKPIGKILDNAI